MKTYIFSIRTLTNLHPGSGDAGGYGAVDKLVQRDPATNLPIIHASSIKGALREYFTVENPIDDKELERIFGASPKPPKPGEEREAKRGEYRFFSADLLALPIPTDASPYFEIVGNDDHTKKIEGKLEDLGAKSILLNGKYKSTANLKELAEELPVIARNHLDNGVSQNLWYEEIVPRESLFIICIQAKDDVLVKNMDKKVIQLGGNATVGYGYCYFELLND